jgi:hypothetical protein
MTASEEHPVTHAASYAWTLPEAMKRYDELTDRELLSAYAAILRKNGEFDPEDDSHQIAAKTEPLTADEHLELIALGGRIAAYYGSPVLIDRALKAGVTREQVGAALGAEARKRAEAWLGLEAGS